MTRARNALIALVVASLGIWGCAKTPAPGAAGSVERIKALEMRNAKLEDDFRAAAAARDQARKKVAAAEEQQQQLRQQLDGQLQVVTKERDELQKQLNLRTGERDAMLVQYEAFRKNIRELLGQAEAAIEKPNDPPVTSVEVVLPGKS